ncbi:MAG: ACT domain-containing protein [archaeon GB-1867-005]|nr:ACT domain-containing protein [Candidatus Culexmicrobium cathedralense]
MSIYLDLPLLIDTKGREVYLFLVELKDVPGALEKLTNIISGNNVDIRSAILIPSIEKQEVGHILIYLDFTHTRVDPSTLSEELRELDVVNWVKYIKPQYNNLIVNTFSFPIAIMGEKALLFRAEWLRELFKRLLKRFGSGGKAFLFYMGFEGGRSSAIHLKNKTNLTGRSLVEAILKIMQAMGHGIFELEKCSLEPLEIVIKAKELYECASNETIEEGGSQFIRGFLSGVLSEAFKMDLLAIEVKCQSKGDECCEFHVQKTNYGK